MVWYYRYETKGIQRWILDSNRLRDLAGGSALVEGLTDRARDGVEVAGGQVTYAAAGGLSATFADLDALASFANEWPMVVAHEAPGLQVVQAWLQDEGQEDPLGDLFRKVAARRNLPQNPTLEAGPWLERAGRSGLPAVPPPNDISPTRARPTSWDEPSVVRERALRMRGSEGRVFGKTLAFHEIHEDVDRWPEGPLAVIHADGTGVGQRLAELGTSAQVLQAFSSALEASSVEATQVAVDDLRERQGDKKLHIRPVVLGGDDLTVILPANDTVAFVRSWLETFEERTRDRAAQLGGEGLHAGAGIAFVHRGYPFSMAYELAEHACKEAKLDAREHGGGSALRFRRVTTALADDAGRGVTWMLGQMGPLQDLVAVVRTIPRGSLRSWLGLLDGQRDSERAALWRRIREVSGEDTWQDFTRALISVGVDPETGFSTRDPSKTPLRDVLALARLDRNHEEGDR